MPFAVLQPWVDSLLDTLVPEPSARGPRRGVMQHSRVLHRCAREFAPHAPPATLDRIVERAGALGLDPWQRLGVIVPIAVHHPTRGAALLHEIRSILARVVMLPQGGTALAQDEVPLGADTLLLALDAITTALPALPPADRREFHRRAIGLLDSIRTESIRHKQLRSFGWDRFAASLDPDLREAAIRAVCGFEYRPAALEAVGTMAAAFPPEARHLALQGLARLADPIAPAAVAAAIARLRDAPVAPMGSAGAVRSNVALNDDDRVRLQMFASVISPESELHRFNLGAVCEVLSAAAAEQVAASLDDYNVYDADKLARALVDQPVMRGSQTREALLCRVIDRSVRWRYSAEWSWIAARIAEVCGRENEAFWIERVATILDPDPDAGHVAVEVEKWLARLEAFGPLLRRFGGDALVNAVVARLEAPLPPPSFAVPWSLARGMVIEA